MKSKILLACITLGLTSTLSAHTFFNTEENNHYKSFQNEINKFFSDDSFFNFPHKHYKINFANSYPKLNIFDNEENYTLKFEIAGMEKKDITVTINDQNILSITGEKEKLSKEQKDNLIMQEHNYDKFARSIKLPDNIDSKKIKITYENGILQIVIKKDSKKRKEGVRKLSID